MLKSLLAAVVTLALLTCPFPARAYEKTILKVGMGDPIDSEMGAIGTRFKEVVEARSEGKVEVQLFPSGQLGDETEMIQNVRAGNLDIAVVGIANTVPFVKKLGILTMPYLFDDMYDVVRATTGPAHDLLNGYAIREGGFRILGWTYTDYRYISNSRKPIKNLNDIKGLKFRVPQSAILLACYKAWGRIRCRSRGRKPSPRSSRAWSTGSATATSPSSPVNSTKCRNTSPKCTTPTSSSP